jgi:hypothetical protein
VRKKRTTKITVETERVFVIRSHIGEVEGWCDGCGERVRMVTSEKAVALAGVSLRSICRRVEAEDLHFTETNDGLLFICLNSLLKLTATESENRISSQVTDNQH